MKKIALVLLTIAFAVGCSSAKTVKTNADSAANSLSFEYTASTRGAYKKVVVTSDSIVTIKDHAMKDVVTKSIGKSDWNQLVAASGKLNVEGLKDIDAPSKKHQFDGALAANLKIIRDGKEYNSTTFDHGNPPAGIKSLVDKIIMISDLDKR
ncbi:hypothetical protein R1T16_05105 [Flavobacterium sp. DG1-102-2]|uniref:hypothetical protein n=1 Tax=Flavobacterium sp. DG1-102-2 TaxID=3081663 RepID=UPI0029493EB8|nr:hypothetical protein [Flavobacterium sp. DG1-102-2]MDV6167792.1 hypothetical protein [Flavobacterium sp. DG1-102-2]